jgi:hypothetical protein
MEEPWQRIIEKKWLILRIHRYEEGLGKNCDSCTVTPKEWGVSEVSA